MIWILSVQQTHLFSPATINVTSLACWVVDCSCVTFPSIQRSSTLVATFHNRLYRWNCHISHKTIQQKTPTFRFLPFDIFLPKIFFNTVFKDCRNNEKAEKCVYFSWVTNTLQLATRTSRFANIVFCFIPPCHNPAFLICYSLW